jgi:hypothetical protein
MTRAKDISKIVTDADLSGTLDVAGELQVGVDGTTAGLIRLMDSGSVTEEATISTDANGGLIFGGNSGPGELIFRTGSSTERMRINSAGSVSIGTSSSPNNAPLLIKCATDDNIRISQQTHASIQAVNDAASAFTELKLDGSTLLLNSQSGGKVGLGIDPSTLPSFVSHAMKIVNGGGLSITSPASGDNRYIFFGTGTSSSDVQLAAIKNSSSELMFLGASGAERMRIDTNGNLLVGTTTNNTNVVGSGFNSDGFAFHTRSGGQVLAINRQSNDGALISFRQDNAEEGTISVSGTTISYIGGHLSRWSQLADNTRDNTIVKGTVMTNLDQMAEWTTDGVTEDNEQLNCMAVSSVEGDANVAGVFVNWDNDDDIYTNDMNIAMTGDMVIRIAQGTTVTRGDLLMSAGDGTAKPQGDDIVRSKTIAKVTSTNVSHTYDDGTYLVPCVLMAC